MRKAKFYLYRNLHTGGFSVKHKGLVCARGDIFIMDNVEFRVSEPGSNRAKREQQRNVHAYMVADSYKKPAKVFSKMDFKALGKLHRITYNPYKHDTFVDAETEEPITDAKYAIAILGKVYIK